MSESQTAAIGIVTVSDRASAGTYNDVSGPAIEEFLREVLTTPWRAVVRLIPDGIDSVRDTLIDLADRETCALIFTTGGTGPAPRDLTPEGTVAACTRLMPGFGELMRMESLKQVPTAILSRQTAGTAGVHPHDDASRVPGDSLLPRLDRGGAHRHRPGALQGVPAAAVTLLDRTQGFA
jgi:molybdopterin adenylyltransferase